jgi:hypothetical protein
MTTTTTTDTAGGRRPTSAAANTRDSRPAFRTIGDLADAFDPGTLAAMQYDAEQLAARNDETAGAWQALADALGEPACSPSRLR